MIRGRTMKLFDLAVTALFTALVCIATIVFSIYVPATYGFFNLGESMVFLSAILFGPLIGAFAGGVGSAFADLLLGFPHYAAATLIIKACEGAIVGTLTRINPDAYMHAAMDRLITVLPCAISFFLFSYELMQFRLSETILFSWIFAFSFIFLLWLEDRKRVKRIEKQQRTIIPALTRARMTRSWRFLTLGVITGTLLGWVGTVYYSGELELTLGSSLFILNVPAEFWLFLGILTAIAITALGFLADPKFGWTVFSVVAGGFTMVIGYFLYQTFLIYPLFNIQVLAVFEIPINIGQMIIGATIALPISKIVTRSIPYIRRR